MLKEFAYVYPLVGRVAIGEVVREEGKSPRPVKHDYFSVTTQAKINGAWVAHPVQSKLMASDPEKKLRSIPIRVLFDDPSLVMTESYVAFDKDGRQLCRGDGQTARQLSQNSTSRSEVTCPSPSYCTSYCARQCKLLGRLDFSIATEQDTSGFSFEAFAIRTSGINSVRALRTKLELFAKAFGGLRGLPLNLVLRTKNSKKSMCTNFYYVDLELGCEFMEGAKRVKAFKSAATEAGINLDAMDEMMKSLINGDVAETDEDIEEFEEVLVGQGFSLNDGWGDTQAPGMEESITEAPLRNANWIAEGLSRASTGMI